MQSVIELIETHAQKIKAGEIENVCPGMPVAFTRACQAGDVIRQGDLYLEIVDEVPGDYILCKKPLVQLVPGNTQGSRHCLDGLRGVKMYLPKEWNEESLQGPCLVLTEDREVLHPVHGAVSIPSGFTVLCSYQREYDKELKKERRTRD